MESRLIRSSGGVFEVALDGAMLYSKKRTGEFPEEAAIIEMIRKRKGR